MVTLFACFEVGTPGMGAIRRGDQVLGPTHIASFRASLSNAALPVILSKSKVAGMEGHIFPKGVSLSIE